MRTFSLSAVAALMAILPSVQPLHSEKKYAFSFFIYVLIRSSVSLSAVAALMAILPFASQAEITLLKQDPQAGDPLSRLNFTFGGSIRAQFNHQTGVDDKSYKRDGFDGGTRFRFGADYYLFDDVSWISYYELMSGRHSTDEKSAQEVFIL